MMRRDKRGFYGHSLIPGSKRNGEGKTKEMITRETTRAGEAEKDQRIRKSATAKSRGDEGRNLVRSLVNQLQEE